MEESAERLMSARKWCSDHRQQSAKWLPTARLGSFPTQLQITLWYPSDGTRKLLVGDLAGVLHERRFAGVAPTRRSTTWPASRSRCISSPRSSSFWRFRGIKVLQCHRIHFPETSGSKVTEAVPEPPDRQSSDWIFVDSRATRG